MKETPRSRSRFYSFGPFCLDVSRLLLLKDGQPLPLAPRFFRVLSLLVQNHGRDLSKEYLMSQLWPDTAVEENNLTVIISGLRKTLGEDLGEHRYIVTIPGRGYRFVADIVETIAVPKAENSIPEIPPPTVAQTESALSVGSPASRNLYLWLGLTTLLVGSLALGIWSMKARTTAAKANGSYTIAVLPFDSSGSGSQDEYLGLGMADALAARLRSIRQLLVRPTNEILAYQDSGYSPGSIGRMLNANVLLTGTVNRVGDRINVNAKLQRAADAEVLWSEQMSGEIRQIFMMQDHIAERVASTLMHNITASPKRDATRPYTKDPQAYEFYLHGQYLLSHRTRSSAQDDFEKAIAYFQQATDRDQSFALAYAGMASAYNKMGWYLPAEDSVLKAETAAQRALALDANLAEAYRALAVAKQGYDWDFAAADAAYRRAIELDPEDSLTHRWYVDELLATGRYQEAATEWHKAQQLDPYITLYDTLGHVYFYSRRYREAFLEMHGKLDVDPDTFWYLAWIYRFHRADLDNNETLTLSPPLAAQRQPSQCDLAYAESVKVGETTLQSCLVALQKGVSTPDITPYKIALVYVAMKDKDKAFHWLDRARLAHTWDISYIKVDPRIDDLRADPRFDALLGRMHLKE